MQVLPACGWCDGASDRLKILHWAQLECDSLGTHQKRGLHSRTQSTGPIPVIAFFLHLDLPNTGRSWGRWLLSLPTIGIGIGNHLTWNEMGSLFCFTNLLFTKLRVFFCHTNLEYFIFGMLRFIGCYFSVFVSSNRACEQRTQFGASRINFF